MLDSDKRDFVKYFTEMCSLYPTTPVDDTRPHAYFRHLRDCSLESVKIALRKASGDGRQFLPTAPEIREIALIEEKAAYARRNDPPRIEPARQLGAARWVSVPKTVEGQKAYITEAPSRFEKLARIWECESVRRGDHPTGEIPRDDGMKRMQQVHKMIGALVGNLPAEPKTEPAK
jgi:hypothetical protein